LTCTFLALDERPNELQNKTKQRRSEKFSSQFYQARPIFSTSSIDCGNGLSSVSGSTVANITANIEVTP
jgi:hypothetical protein